MNRPDNRPFLSRRKRATQFDYQRLEARQVLSTWIPQGPFSATDGQVENITPEDRIAGAIHTVIAHPTNADVIYVGGTNAGIWKTENATDLNPDWVPLTDTLPSQSIGALTFDAGDSSGQTLYAGVGRYSSFGRTGNSRVGVYKSTDGGTSWAILNDNLVGANISGIAANGDNVVVSVNTADNFTLTNTGIFRSTDGGTTFTRVSVGDGSATGLPEGASYDLVADPINPDILYTSTVFSDLNGSGVNGVYKSTTGGATWAKVSNAAMDAVILSNGTSNLEMAVGRQNNVYAAVINFGNLVGLWRSGDGGATWAQMDTPSTNENGTDVGLNPKGGKGPQASDDPSPPELAGGQGAIHFSIIADPDNANIVYVGGDRQPRSFGDAGSFPNSIGARDFSGRLFRGDATEPAGSQFVHLTHSSSLGAPGGGTASSSSPHADSREMAFDANGDLIEVDDGGVYRRTSPQDNTGDWFSITGSIQVTEAHDVAYDNLSNTFATGNQDTGTTYQPAQYSDLWVSLSTADGGDVVIDTVSRAATNESVRYSSFQNLGGFRRTVWDASGNLVSTNFPALAGFNNDGAFVTPVELNAIDPNRLAIQGRSSTYETFDQAQSVTSLTAAGNGGIFQNAVAYGGRQGGVDNADVLWVGSGSNVFVRPNAGDALAATTNPGFGTIRDLSLDPDDWATAFAIDNNQIFTTMDVGASWTDITGDLLSFASSLYSTSFIATARGDAVLVGTNLGVYASMTDSLGTWTRVGFDLPNVLTFDMDYDPVDDVLFVGTLGRGVWSLPVASVVVIPGVPLDFGDAPDTAQSGFASSYRVTLAEGGASHVEAGPTLGLARDVENDGTHSSDALADDLDFFPDDEDGVTLPASLTVSTSNPTQGFVGINLQNADPNSNFLDAWVDWNRDGDWSDPGEQILTNYDLGTVNGVQSISFTIPQDLGDNIEFGNSFARFRVSTTGHLLSTGTAGDGEVEDHRVLIENAIAPTDGDDIIFVTIDNVFVTIDINGQIFQVDSRFADDYSLDGKGGNDQITVLSSFSDHTATIRDKSVSMDGLFDFSAVNVETIELFSRSGVEQVNIFGTPLDEMFESFGNRSTLAGDDFFYGVRNYGQTNIDGQGGNDQAIMFGSDQTDRLMADEFAVNFNRPEYDVRVVNVAKTYAYAGGGDTNFADLRGTDGDDIVTAGDSYLNLVGPGMWINVGGFSRVDARGGMGFNRAYLADETGRSDLFFTSPRMGYMDGADYFNYVDGFDEIYGISTDQLDRAIMNDSPFDDTLYATPNFATLTGLDYRVRANQFRRVTTIASAGNNIATLMDSAGDDVYVAEAEFAFMQGSNYLNYIRNFDRVDGRSSTGFDKAILKASIGESRFRGSFSNAVLIGLTGTDFANSARNFDRLTVTANPVGNSVAEIFDSPEDDTFIGNGDKASIFNSTSIIVTTGFKRVIANKVDTGIDRLFASNLNYDLNVIGDWQ